jgi:hypothetical protein
MVGRRGQRQGRRVEHPSVVQQRRAVLKIQPLATNILARRDRLERLHHAVAGGAGVFLDQNGVGTLGHHAACEDTHRLAGSEHAGERFAGRRLADHAQARRRARNVGGAHRVTVHGRGVERRLGAQRGKRRGQDTVGAVGDRQGFGLEPSGPGKQPGQGLVDRHQAHGVSLRRRRARHRICRRFFQAGECR